MSIYFTIYATEPSSGATYVRQSDTSWETVATGGGAATATGTTSINMGAVISGSTYLNHQGFLQYDLSALSSVSSGTFNFRKTSGQAETLDIRVFDWSTSVTTSDYRSRSQVEALTKIAEFTTAATNSVYYSGAITAPESVSPSATYRVVVHSQNQLTSGSAPTNTTSTIFDSVQAAGTTNDPYVTVIGPNPWSFVGKSASVTSVTSGNITPTEPASVAQGDLLVACIAYRDSAAFTLPSGGEWTTVATQQSSGNAVATNSAIASGLMAYCVRGASAPNYTFTRTAGNLALANVYAYRGVNTTTPYDTGSANTLAADSATATTGTFTTAEDDELIVAMVSGGQEGTVSAFESNSGSTIASSGTSADVTAAPAPNVFQERSDDQSTSGADGSLTVADAVLTAAGATGTIQATHTNASVQHVMIAGAFKLAQAVTKARPIFRRPVMFFSRSF